MGDIPKPPEVLAAAEQREKKASPTIDLASLVEITDEELVAEIGDKELTPEAVRSEYFQAAGNALSRQYYRGDSDTSVGIMISESGAITILSPQFIEPGSTAESNLKESLLADIKQNLATRKKIDVKMGSYGIGVSRLVGAIIEAKINNDIMKWPNSIAPFEVAIIPSLQKNDKSNFLKAEKIYNLLLKSKIDVLFDDTEEHLSAKFKKFDLIGIPYQIILGSKSSNDKFEFKEINGKTEILSLDEIKNKLLNKRNLN